MTSSDPTSTSPSLNGVVERLAFGGEGIVRPEEGPTAFIPFTAARDRIRYTLTEQKKRFSRGKVLEIIDPSPDRTLPLCRHYGVCGGCQLQHLNYQTQLATKRQWIVDALERIGGFKDVNVQPVEPAELQWEYRRHVALTLTPKSSHFEIGYIAYDLSGIVAIEECPIFSAEMPLLIQELRRACQQLKPTSQRPGRAVLFKGQAGYCLDLHFDQLPSNGQQLISQWEIGGLWQSATLHTPHKTYSQGSHKAFFSLEGLKIQASSRAFLQNHPEQSLKIYRYVREKIRQENVSHLLDLYCGIGITSLLFSLDGCKVTGVESNREAVRIAKENARHNNLTTIDFRVGYVEDVIEELIEKVNPQLIFLNPPREGLDEKVIAAVSASRVKKILYLSCLPSTLARDLQRLSQLGFKLEEVRPYDMFPQTTHVETLVSLAREQ